VRVPAELGMSARTNRSRYGSRQPRHPARGAHRRFDTRLDPTGDPWAEALSESQGEQSPRCRVHIARLRAPSFDLTTLPLSLPRTCLLPIELPPNLRLGPPNGRSGSSAASPQTEQRFGRNGLTEASSSRMLVSSVVRFALRPPAGGLGRARAGPAIERSAWLLN
jgi:hypothetical protein